MKGTVQRRENKHKYQMAQLVGVTVSSPAVVIGFFLEVNIFFFYNIVDITFNMLLMIHGYKYTLSLRECPVVYKVIAPRETMLHLGADELLWNGNSFSMSQF